MPIAAYRKRKGGEGRGQMFLDREPKPSAARTVHLHDAKLPYVMIPKRALQPAKAVFQPSTSLWAR